MGIATFGAGMGAGYKGFTDGVRTAKADQMQDALDANNLERIDAEKELRPAQTQLTKDKMASASQDLADKEELRPAALDLAKATSAFQVQDAIHKTAIEAMSQPSRVAEIQQNMLGQIGEVAQSGDPAMLGAAIEQAARTPLLPNLNNVPPIKAASIIDAPAGTTDSAGNAIVGKAIQLQHADGTTSFLSAAPMAGAWAKRKAAIDKANEIKLNAGQTLIRGGQTYTGDMGYETIGTDEKGNPITRKIGTSGTGTGAGKTGKEALPDAELNAAVDDVVKNLSEKDPVAAAKIPLMAKRANEAGLSVREAVYVAADAAQNPGKVRTQLNVKTGSFDDYYSDPKIQGGQGIPLASGTKSFEEATKGMDPKTIAAQVQEMLAPLGPRQGDFVKMAFDPAASKTFVDSAAAVNPAKGAEAARKIDLIRRTMAPGGGPAKSSGGGVGEFLSKAKQNMFGEGAPKPAGVPKTGGMEPPASYQRDTRSPVERAAANRAAATKERTEREAAEKTGNAEAAASFAADSKKLSPVELLQKYDGKRSALSPADLQVLKTAESKI